MVTLCTPRSSLKEPWKSLWQRRLDRVIPTSYSWPWVPRAHPPSPAEERNRFSLSNTLTSSLVRRVPRRLRTEAAEMLFQEFWQILMEMFGRPPMKMQELGLSSNSNPITKLDKLSTRAGMTSKIKHQNYSLNSATNQSKSTHLKNSLNLKNSICKLSSLTL